MTGYEGKTRRLQPPCPYCGGTTFVWGNPIGHSNPVVFIQDGLSWRDLWRQGKDTQMRARVCETCGGVQLFLNKPPGSRSSDDPSDGKP